MAKLSVVLVTHNEEKFLRECLESVSFAGEILVVDTGSTDKTVRIAKEFTNKVIFETNKPNPNKNMNIGFEAATGEWILLTAPDERISQELKEEILQVINSSDSLDGYFIPRKNFFLGKWLKHGGNYPDWQLRLFKKGKGKFPEKHIHEFLRVEGQVGYLKSPLIHYPYRELSDLLQKIKLYGEGDFDYLQERGWQIKPPNYLWFFALRPFLIFCRNYFWRLGFLDGVEGLIFAISSAYADFYRSAYYWHKSRGKKP
jgi:glycosyltransferase involved in cell wall biosynthesis